MISKFIRFDQLGSYLWYQKQEMSHLFISSQLDVHIVVPYSSSMESLPHNQLNKYFYSVFIFLSIFHFHIFFHQYFKVSLNSMAEPDDEKPSSGFHLNINNQYKSTRETTPLQQQPHAVENHHLMDVDMVDIDSSWPLDQILFVPNPMSPSFISSSDQPFSPLWAFSDPVYDIKASVAGFGGGGGGGGACGGSVKQSCYVPAVGNGFRLPEYPRFLARK